MSSTRKYALPALLLIAFIAEIAVGATALLRSITDAKVAPREREIAARIVEYSCGEDDCLAYVFSIDGKKYQGTYGLSASPGQSVMVFFDPDDPSTNSEADFGENSRSHRRMARNHFWIALAFAALWVVVGPVASAVDRQRAND